MNILILGTSKSGTTVVSQEIFQSLSGKVEYIFEPTTVEPFEIKPEAAHTVTKIVFDHWVNKKQELAKIINNAFPLKFDKRIIIHRDPRDVWISVLLYYPFDLKRMVTDKSLFASWINFLQKKEQNPASVSFLSMCNFFDSLFHVNLTSSMSKVSSFNGGFFPFCKRIDVHHHILKYEDYITGDTKALSNYLNMELSGNRTVDDKYAHTFRTGTFNNWKRYFTTEDVEYFGKQRAVLQGLGYTDWELLQVDHIPEKELSGYVKLLLEK
ncbi:hypothetical protein [Maridesulfovibrio bastinii]|uniref:hypothetical protein n=1 Tax=Maridesulfovibrio bastinii TaxID=47157 RepID=UPI0003F9DF25|nr:hypothetical protein [Maridesulfovibrio bastinii]